MIAPPMTAPIYVVKEPIKFNTRLKGTIAVCREVLDVEPMDGALIVFRNRGGTRLRLIFYDGDGFWLCEKHFSKGNIKKWIQGSSSFSSTTARELSVLLWRGDPQSASFPDLWKSVQSA